MDRLLGRRAPPDVGIQAYQPGSPLSGMEMHRTLHDSAELVRPRPKPTGRIGRFVAFTKRLVKNPVVLGAIAAILLIVVARAIGKRIQMHRRKCALNRRCRNPRSDVVAKTVFVCVVARGPYVQRHAALLVGALFEQAEHPTRVSVGVCLAEVSTPPDRWVKEANNKRAVSSSLTFASPTEAADGRGMPRHGGGGGGGGGGGRGGGGGGGHMGAKRLGGYRSPDVFMRLYHKAYPHHGDKFVSRIRVLTEQEAMARGPANALFLATRHLYRGERYFAVVSARCRPCAGWDTRSVADHERASIIAPVPPLAIGSNHHNSASGLVFITMRAEHHSRGRRYAANRSYETDDGFDSPRANGETGDDDDDDDDDLEPPLRQPDEGSVVHSRQRRRQRLGRHHEYDGMTSDVMDVMDGADGTGDDASGRKAVPPVFCAFSTWSAHGVPRLVTRRCQHPPVRPLVTPYWHSDFAMARSAHLINCADGSGPWDPWLEHLPLVEEVDWCVTLRLWTHGWTFFTPTASIVSRAPPLDHVGSAFRSAIRPLFERQPRSPQTPPSVDDSNAKPLLHAGSFSSSSYSSSSENDAAAYDRTAPAHHDEALALIGSVAHGEAPRDGITTASERAAARKRVWALMGILPADQSRSVSLGRFGLGDARTIQQYMEHCGIDWIGRRALAHAFVGMAHDPDQDIDDAMDDVPAFNDGEVITKYGSWARFLDETGYRPDAVVYY